MVMHACVDYVSVLVYMCVIVELLVDTVHVTVCEKAKVLMVSR